MKTQIFRSCWITGCLIGLGMSPVALAEDEVYLDDSASPNILYVLPWEAPSKTKVAAPKLVLHQLMDDLYDPVLPDATLDSVSHEAATTQLTAD